MTNRFADLAGRAKSLQFSSDPGDYFQFTKDNLPVLAEALTIASRVEGSGDDLVRHARVWLATTEDELEGRGKPSNRQKLLARATVIVSAAADRLAAQGEREKKMREERDALYNQIDAIVDYLGIADNDVTPIDAIRRIEHRVDSIADRLFVEIVHGDEQHRAWLRQKFEAFFGVVLQTATLTKDKP